MELGDETGLEGERRANLRESEGGAEAKREPYSDREPVLPDSTRDDTDAGWGERPRDNAEWLRGERPPHWD